MRQADLDLRSELAREGSLFQGYNERMAELHRGTTLDWLSSSPRMAGRAAHSLAKTAPRPCGSCFSMLSWNRI